MKMKKFWACFLLLITFTQIFSIKILGKEEETENPDPAGIKTEVLGDTIEPVEIVDIVEPVVSATDSIEIFYPDYEKWEVVSLEGKLKMQGLPLSPSLKIFMQRDSLLSISVRAPFVGEAGRMDLNPDSVLIVNKMNKTYVSEGIREFLKYYPGGLADVQDLLLGRFFLPGCDVTEVDLDDYIDIYFEDDQINIVPKGSVEIPGVKYGFVVDNLFNPLMLIVMPEGRNDAQIAAIYTHKLQGYDIRFIFQDSNRLIEATMEMKNPEWKGSAPKPMDLKKFRKVGLADLMKGF